MPSKPLIIISSNYGWTIFNFRMGLIKGLQQVGYEVIVVSEADGYETQIGEVCRFIPLKKLVRDGKNPIQDFALFREYRKLYSALKPALVLHYTIKPNIYGNLAAGSLGIPVLSTINGLGATFSKKGLVQTLVRGLYRTALKRAAHVIFQNLDDRQLFLDMHLVEADKTSRVAGSGVDTQKFAPNYIPTEGNSLTFLMAARLLRTKGIPEYAESAKQVSGVYPGVKCLLLGAYAQSPGALQEDEIHAWEADGAIHYEGVTDDMPGYFRKADVVVLPSYYREGVPRVLLEALAMGKPIITTDSIGCRETVVDGVNGYLIPTQDVAALADAMRKLIEMPLEMRLEMGQESRKLAETVFDETQVVAVYLDKIQKILAS